MYLVRTLLYENKHRNNLDSEIEHQEIQYPTEKITLNTLFLFDSLD